MPLSKQEIFNQVVVALRIQGKPSMHRDDILCAYRSDDGLKCAAGHIITDDEYQPWMDRNAPFPTSGKDDIRFIRYVAVDIISILKYDITPSSLKERVAGNESFLAIMQEIHDRGSQHSLGFLPYCEQQWAIVAEDHGLTMPEKPIS